MYKHHAEGKVSTIPEPAIINWLGETDEITTFNLALISGKFMIAHTLKAMQDWALAVQKVETLRDGQNAPPTEEENQAYTDAVEDYFKKAAVFREWLREGQHYIHEGVKDFAKASTNVQGFGVMAHLLVLSKESQAEASKIVTDEVNKFVGELSPDLNAWIDKTRKERGLPPLAHREKPEGEHTHCASCGACMPFKSEASTENKEPRQCEVCVKDGVPVPKQSVIDDLSGLEKLLGGVIVPIGVKKGAQ